MVFIKKLIVLLFSCLVIVASLRAINYLAYPPIEYALDRTSTVVSDERVYNYGEHFKTFSKDDLYEFEFNHDDLNISYDGYVLNINEKVINDVSQVYELFSIYDDSVLVMEYVAESISNVLIYNYKDNTEDIITKYKEMLVDFSQPITFDDEGITLSFTSIVGGKFIKNNKNICKEKDNSKVVLRTFLYTYNSNNKTFKKDNELYSMSLLSYKNKYNLCD